MRYKNVYFIGIGGIGMSAIARYYKFKGFNVAGYDRTPSELTGQLEAEGIVASAQEFLIQERVSDYAGKYVAGTYALSSEMTTEEILRVISGTETSRFAEELAQENPEAAVPAAAAEGSGQ